jgi:predicted Rdx family selenoprotein
VANVIQDFELHISSIVIRPYDDGRFLVLLGGQTIYDKDRTGRFPKYDVDIKPRLSRTSGAGG